MSLCIESQAMCRATIITSWRRKSLSKEMRFPRRHRDQIHIIFKTPDHMVRNGRSKRNSRAGLGFPSSSAEEEIAANAVDFTKNTFAVTVHTARTHMHYVCTHICMVLVRQNVRHLLATVAVYRRRILYTYICILYMCVCVPALRRTATVLRLRMRFSRGVERWC